MLTCTGHITDLCLFCSGGPGLDKHLEGGTVGAGVFSQHVKDGALHNAGGGGCGQSSEGAEAADRPLVLV